MQADAPDGFDGWLKLLQEPWVKQSIVDAIKSQQRGVVSQFKFIETFSRIAALLGRALPEPFRVNQPTLSEELAVREGTNLLGSHLIMLREVTRLGDGRLRAIGNLAMDLEIANAREDDVLEGILVLPKGQRLRKLREFRKLQRSRRSS